MEQRTCSIEGCERPHQSKGYCKPHYQAWYRTGDANNYGKPREQDLATRLWRNIERGEPDECWPWTGSLHSQGYGQIHIKGKGPSTAHRVLYELEHGPLSRDTFVDHTCHNRDLECPGGKVCRHRRCCNPAHLEPATNRENQERSRLTLTSANALKTHCPHDHLYEGENLYVVPKTGQRQCRRCKANAKTEFEGRARAAKSSAF